ncbi:flavin-containing monooxygenase [Rhizobium sp. 9140]|uniref:flavin-containing monooxygenase n=1 Tax=Rhizobium sp. 9140 TaxID=1761900 RepID=UPI00079523F2|nr:NAD(P)/FAD-dependent oxidoreductase [Rhizobium sp. 9140]CZT37013.1 Predicted flavoprotein CzcO associated with the cation diffusion facilitator CzcD [Rhizobium sp. 9140]
MSQTPPNPSLASLEHHLPNVPDLAHLEAQVRRDLDSIEASPRAWVPERRDAYGNVISDVVIVGAGLTGLSLAFGLKRQGIERVRLIDAAPAGLEGPWLTTARMRTLRSPKTLSGPDLGIPSLTYRAWHEAVEGHESWEQLDKIDRQAWMAYLAWFRSMIGLPVENDTRLLSISQVDDHLRLQVENGGQSSCIACRKVVLATGLEGAGGFNVPPDVATLPRTRWTHSGELIDPGILSAKRVGVIGAAASSFDWAVTALEAGATSVTLLARSPVLPRTEILDWSNFPGFLNHFADLDDQTRYRFTRRMFDFKTPPTNEMYGRAMAFPDCRLVTGARICSIGMTDDAVVISTAKGDFVFDHLLLGTGYSVDLSRRPELASHVDQIATWADRFVPATGEEDPDLLAYPYLGPAFELMEKTPGALPMLANIHVFNSAAVPSLGPICNGITGLKSGVPKLVSGICRGLFLSDIEHFYRSLDRYDKTHFQPEPV